jgi:hypothetical protein
MKVKDPSEKKITLFKDTIPGDVFLLGDIIYMRIIPVHLGNAGILCRVVDPKTGHVFTICDDVEVVPLHNATLHLEG